MSTRGFIAMIKEGLPSFEPMEPRLLLSAVPVDIAADDFALSAARLPLSVDAIPAIVADKQAIVRSDLRAIAAAIADLKALNPAGDASAAANLGSAGVNPAGEIRVTIRFDTGQPGIVDALTATDFRPISVRQEFGSISGWLSYADVNSMGDIAGVKEVSLDMPLITNAGSITTAGDGILNADDLRSLLSVDGTGIKVGVISDGVHNWQDVRTSGDLPQSITIDGTRPGLYGKNEGTAMLEIINDLAPGADLYFSGPQYSSELADSIEWLVAQGCDVIVDDLSTKNAPFFEDGDVALAALDAIDEGVVYVSAAGNYAQKHYQGQFDGNANSLHEFAQGDIYLTFDLINGQKIEATLEWSDEWGASGNDYDLYLCKKNGGSWNVVDYSWFTQDGDDNPWEYIEYTNTGSSDTFGWVIAQYSGSDRELELYMYGAATFIDYGVESDSIYGHAAAEGVIAVGAIDASDSGNDDIESFSSQGASTIYTDFANQTSTTRNSLDVAGIDGVSTKAGDLGYFQSEPFYGTSAAAPHVAAIAALLLEINPSLAPADIVDLLNDNAVDLGDAGYDDVFGSGRVDALATVSAATGTPNLDDDSDTGVYNYDNITKLDNSAAGKELAFLVTGTISGATVTLYAGETEIGSAVAAGTSVTITTNGTEDLTDAEHAITAKQTEPDKLESVASDSVAVTVDTLAPTVTAFARYYQAGNWKLRPTTLDTITITFSEDVYDEDSDGLSLYNLSTSQSLSPGYTFSGQETDEFTWYFNELNLTSNPGWYSVTISGDLTDLAGNGLGGDDYVYGVDTLQKDMLIPILGDANLDGAVSYTDLQILMANYGQSPRDWQHGDFNYDGVVDASDYITVKQHMGQSVSR